MAQARNTFIKSKLNKDLDARLLPQGEYRDAFNIQVSKSEGSNVGSLENVLGNYKVLDLDELTGVSGLSCIGEVHDDSTGFVYLFLTNNDLASYVVNAENFIVRYDTSGEGLLYANILVKGSFLNFSTQFKIYGVNILEGLLYWTDNHNQPRVINTALAEASVLHYVNEDQISVAKYNPYKSIELYDVVSNEPETTMYDVTSKFYPNGGLGSVSGSYTGGNIIVLTNVIGNLVDGNPYDTGAVFSYIDSVGDIIDTTQVIDSFAYADTTTTPSAAEPTWTITLDGATGVTLVDGQEVVFNANKYYEPTFSGDPDYLESLFARFSYRFKFEDNEYSVFAPFTQTAFIPKQDGYFLYTPNYLTDQNINYNGLQEVNDQDSAYASTIVSFVENKTDKIKLKIPLPCSADTLRNNFKIKELDILFKESDGLAVKVVDTISISEIETQATNSDVFEYNYLSKKPYKTLPSSDLTRVYDKTPVRAFSQEIISNRIVYGNFQDKHTPLQSINYSVTVSPKEDFNDQTGKIIITTQGTYTAGTAISATFQGSTNVGSPTGYPGPPLVSIVAIDATTVTFDQDITATINGFVVQVYPVGPDQNYVSKVEYPNHTVKQNRNYQVGIVLQDRFGRSSSVILSNNTQKLLNAATGLAFIGDTIYSPYLSKSTPPQDWPGNSLKVLFNEPLLPTAPVPSGALQGWPGVYNGDPTSVYYNPLGWYSYKIVVKQTEQEYYNIYAPGIMAAYPARQGLELSKTSHMVLIGDNINKVPRDLALVGPDQKQFRSSVQIYGRVENNSLGVDWQNISYPTNLGDTNDQYYTGRDSNTVSTVSTLNDLFDYDPMLPPIPNYIPQFYQYESNPLIARISTPKQIGQISTTNYSPASAEAREDQTTTPAFPDLKLQNVEGTILVNSIISSPKLAEGLLVADVDNLESPSIRVKDSTGTAVYVSLNAGDTISFKPGLGGQAVSVNDEGLQTPGIQYLAVYETEPVESLLDIYWETSTSGLVTDLNSLILNSSGGGAGFTPINSTDWTEALPSGGEILSSDFTIQDSFGTAINPSFLTLELVSVFNQAQESIDVQLAPLGPYFALIDENDDPSIAPGYYNITITQNYFDDIFFFRQSSEDSRFFNFNFIATVNDPSNPDGPQQSAFTFEAYPKNVLPIFDPTQQQPADNDTVYKNQFNEIFATYFVLNGALNNNLRWQDLNLTVTSIFDLLSENPTQDLLEDSNQQNDFFTFDGSSALQTLPSGDKSLRCDLKSGVGTGNVVPSNYQIEMLIGDAGSNNIARRLYVNMVFTPTVIQNQVRLQYCSPPNNIELEFYVAITVTNWGSGSPSIGNGVYMYKETAWTELSQQSNGGVFNLNFTNAIKIYNSPTNPGCNTATGSYNNPIFAPNRADAEDLLASICYTCPSQGGGNQWSVVDWTNQQDASINVGDLRFQII
jgi:hypothetical protein